MPPTTFPFHQSPCLIAACVLACAGVPAQASDGVIEINQAIIDAAGAQGYTINKPGSYRLTSNLVQRPSGTVSVIAINAANVTLDLNGHAILGSNVCTGGSGITCSANPDILGFLDPGVTVYGANSVIRNGSISGINGPCITASYSRIENLSVSHCAGNGISMAYGSIHNVQVRYSSGAGINIVSGSVSDAWAQFNGRGLYGNACSIQRSHAMNNFAHGIESINCTILDSQATHNAGTGLVTNTSGYRGMLLLNNGTDLQSPGAPSGAVNTCTSGPCP